MSEKRSDRTTQRLTEELDILNSIYMSACQAFATEDAKRGHEQNKELHTELRALVEVARKSLIDIREILDSRIDEAAKS